ncbi:bacteriohemerythrin [Vibrio sp. JC009]|uniref:bacteriohemerythrin n=1 Tax=Vibrio sp. JC009 TaxID=2912314 RepID=UPI0023AF0F33|nr:bacteriohemerythrin [Vibrio sp. JC009]WED20546.1 bacteriohemerythrin [Vibrio sp. JC009]
MLENHVDIFPWNDNFNTGVAEIDRQHRHLVSILNKVASYVTLQRSHVELDSLIGELVDYAAYHFSSEDSFWLDSLPENAHTEQHRNSHNRFIQSVVDLKAQASEQSEEEWLEELLSFLASWLASHILESDKQMALLVEGFQSGKSIEEASLWAEQQMQGSAKETIDIILAAYKTLSANTIRLMREIQAGDKTLKQLSDSEQHLQEAMNYAKIGSWSFTKEGAVDWSPQIYKIFGLEMTVAPGPDSLRTIMLEQYHEPFETSLQRSFETGQEHRMEYKITRPSDGELRWIECRGQIVHNEDGVPEKLEGFVRDITEQKENEQKIVKLAYYDPLTMLPNRRLLLDRLNHSLAVGERNDKYNALLFIDIDNFKTINDSHGHDYGDLLLKQAARKIQQCIRKGDTLARIGGDEFVVILSDLSSDEIEAASRTELVADKIRRVTSVPYEINNLQFNSSASIGMALFNDNSVPSLDLMKFADIAMYQAKQSGKNSACFYDPMMQQEISERLRLESELRKAITNKHFELYYQPQIDTHNNITGAEALIRWTHPEDGLISPDSFIPLAEETGLIVPIGDWVVESACQQLKKWQQNRSTSHLTLSVNVSYKQFRQPDFVFKISELMTKYGVEKGKLKIELTETMLVDDMETTISHMEKLKEQGIQFSLDDFGTGYSSLQYLKQLPLSQLKIDRSFVSELESNLNDQSIVKTIILMANALGIDVIAEGVETQKQRSYLGTHGCLSYQGYLYSKPVPILDLMELNESFHPCIAEKN